MPSLYVDLVFGVLFGTIWIVLDRYRARKREIVALTLLDYHSTRWAERTRRNRYINGYSRPAFALSIVLFVLRFGFYLWLQPLAKPEVAVVRSILAGLICTASIELIVVQFSFFHVATRVVHRVLALGSIIAGLTMTPALLIVFFKIGFTNFHPLGFIVIATMALGWAILGERQQIAKLKPVG